MEFKAVMYTKTFYNYLKKICHTIEEKELWQVPEQLKMSISEIFQYDVAKFMLFVCSCDGRLSDEHLLMYQIVTGYEGDHEQLRDWLSQHHLYTKNFSATIPLTFRIISESEQNAAARGIGFDTEESISELFSSFFRMLGNILLCDRMPYASPDNIAAYRKTKDGFEKEPYNTMQEFYNLIDSLTPTQTIP